MKRTTRAAPPVQRMQLLHHWPGHQRWLQHWNRCLEHHPRGGSRSHPGRSIVSLRVKSRLGIMILGSVAAVIDKLVSWYTIARFVVLLHIHCTLHRGFIGGLVIGLKGLIQDEVCFFFTMDAVASDVLGVGCPCPGRSNHLPLWHGLISNMVGQPVAV